MRRDDSLSHLSFPLFFYYFSHAYQYHYRQFISLPRLRSCLRTQLAGSPFYHLVPTRAKCRLQVLPEARSLKHVNAFTPFVYIASAGCCLCILGNGATVSEPKPGCALLWEVLVKSTGVGIAFLRLNLLVVARVGKKTATSRQGNSIVVFLATGEQQEG